MTERDNPPADRKACEEDPSVPTCATGPGARLWWSVRELVDLLRRRGRDAS